MKISMIAAMARDRVIGLDNQMPWHLPADLAHFKRVTLGKPVLMGRKTFESIGRPLPGRRNLVISRNAGFTAPGIEVFSSIEDALTTLTEGEAPAELMVIGGGHLYAQLLPRADRLYLTHIDLVAEGDTRFPEYEGPQWRCIEQETHQPDARNPHSYRFETLERIAG
ncbi:type 3 dihydrofolate reductase [Aeromonas bivalvium]|uniref:type 3 dihydrofolate reductase n=1 Tax=Aeromonas bivalvium TaxID=440079 RepID=UPI00370C21A7